MAMAPADLAEPGCATSIPPDTLIPKVSASTHTDRRPATRGIDISGPLALQYEHLEAVEVLDPLEDGRFWVDLGSGKVTPM